MIIIHALIVIAAVVGVVGGLSCMINGETDKWGKIGGVLILIISVACTSYALYFLTSLLSK